MIDELKNGLLCQFNKNVECVTGKCNYLTSENWCKILSLNELKEKEVVFLYDLIFDIVAPMDLVCKKYEITKKEYIRHYMRTNNIMHIPIRQRVLTSIINNNINLSLKNIV